MALVKIDKVFTSCPVRRVSLSAEASDPEQLLSRDKFIYYVSGTIVLSNMPRQFLSRDNMLSRFHVNRVSEGVSNIYFDFTKI